MSAQIAWYKVNEVKAGGGSELSRESVQETSLVGTINISILHVPDP